MTEFFATLATHDFGRFEVVDLMVSSGPSPDPAREKGLVHVAARILLELTSPAGITVEDDEMHLWGIGADGLVHTSRHYADTVKHIAAMTDASH